MDVAQALLPVPRADAARRPYTLGLRQPAGELGFRILKILQPRNFPDFPLDHCGYPTNPQ
jgi:hypothetical protein